MIHFGMWEPYTSAFNPAMIAGAFSLGFGVYNLTMSEPKAATIQIVCGVLFVIASFVIH